MKLQITINGGTLAGRNFDLESGFLTIGRGDNCSIRFDPLSERIASKQHAFIEAKADGYYLTDNNSTNGTMLNGGPISSARLNSGDEIQFGRNGVTATVRKKAFATCRSPNSTRLPGRSRSVCRIRLPPLASGTSRSRPNRKRTSLGNI